MAIFSKKIMAQCVVLASLSILTACQSPQVLSNQAPLPKVAENSQALNIDSDNDGVVNSEDKCSNTEKNIVVTSQGCPVIIEIDLGVRVFFHGIYPKDSINLSSDYMSEIQRATAELKDFTNQWVLVAVFEGNHAFKDDKSLERLISLKDTILKQDKKINPQHIVMYECREKRQFLENIKAKNDLATYLDDINSAKPHSYAFFTNMSQEFAKQNVLLSQQCQRFEQ